MRQRGRRSAADLATLSVDGTPPRLSAPSSLSKDERTLFAALVNACDPRHFVEADLPLLVSFVQATLMARNWANAPSKVTIWEKAVRVQAMLATRLRLAPQARTDPKTLARQQAQSRQCTPWEN
jgi:hypothetical protein